MIRRMWWVLALLGCADLSADPVAGRSVETVRLESALCDAPADLTAGYEGQADSRITVRWNATSAASVRVQTWLDGILRDDLEVAGEGLRTDWGLEEATGLGREIAVRVAVTRTCAGGATARAEQTFVFEDPIARCPVADPAMRASGGDDAAFYRCAEHWADHGAGCGERGYLLGYGARYAERFVNETRPRMSTRGKQWIDDVLVCLQEELRAAIGVGTSCEDIRTTAFDQHPGCYIDSGACALPVFDLVRVVRTIELGDWLGADALRQVVAFFSGCGSVHAGAMRWFFGSAM